MKIQTSEIMGRKNNKEAMSTQNPRITESDNTEMLKSPEGQIRSLIVEMIENFWKEFRESQKEIKEAINEMKKSTQTINNRLDHMEGRISLLDDDSKNEHIVYNLEKTIRQHEWD